MAQVRHIELEAGPDGWYHGAVIILWLLVVVSLVSILPVLPGIVLLACGSLLVLLRPGSRRFRGVCGPLLLYRSGAARLGSLQGTWNPHSRTSRWVTLVRVEMPVGARIVLVCAARNQAQDYRLLLMWSRFPPMDWQAGARAGGQHGAQP
ncbi:MAG TPA: hypothetical protein VI566_02190 [Xanthomonadales bacterium]|nr:hypothetical protein [Xanthomonadales bacterium]